MNWKTVMANKTVRYLAVGAAALVILIAVWAVFFQADAKSDYTPTAEEQRLSLLLSKLEGVEDATVMISEEKGQAVGAVILFEGKDSLLTRMRVLEAAANALRLERERVLVYPASK